MNQSFRSRILPMPAHSILLFVAWLALNNTLAPGHIVLGAILAIAIPILVAGLETPQPKIRRRGLAVRYFFMLIYDIVVANIEVAAKVLGPIRKLNPGFVAVPMDVRDELVITLLASTISLTPGTVSAEVSEDRCWLYVHVLHLDDEAELIRQIKTRYEKNLREIFGC